MVPRPLLIWSEIERETVARVNAAGGQIAANLQGV
jgi:hypothetical protein